MSCVLFGRELEIRVIFIWEGRIRMDKLHVYYFFIEGVNIFYSFCLFFLICKLKLLTHLVN